MLNLLSKSIMFILCNLPALLVMIVVIGIRNETHDHYPIECILPAIHIFIPSLNGFLFRKTGFIVLNQLSKSSMFILYKLRALLVMVVVTDITSEGIPYPLGTSSLPLRM